MFLFLYGWHLSIITYSQSVFLFSSFSVPWTSCGVLANCIPQCHNGGMCLRPQHCVCKPGSEGKACEQKTVPTHSFPPRPGNGPTNGHNTGHTSGHTTGHTNGHTSGNTNVHSVVPQRPIPQQVPPNGYGSGPSPSNNMGQMKLTVKPAPQFVRPHYIQQHIQQQ